MPCYDMFYSNNDIYYFLQNKVGQKVEYEFPDQFDPKVGGTAEQD